MIKIDKNETVIDRKEQIMEKATLLFYKNGYDNTSIRELSHATGLSVAGIYYFFKDKKEILFSILHESVINLNNSLKASISEKDDPIVNLTKMIENLLKHVIEYKMVITILARENERLNDEQFVIINRKKRDAYDLVKNELAKLEKQGKLKSINLTPAIFAVFSMTNWSIRWYDPDGPLMLEEIAAEMAKIFFTGVLKNSKFPPD